VKSTLYFLFASFFAASAHAVPYALSPDGNSVVRITSQTAAAPLNTALITAAYPGWTVVNGGVPGSFNSTTYTAGWNGANGGAQFQGNYTQGSNITAGQQLNYIQIINTNVPLGGATSPYIDPQPNDDTLPFYWTRPEASTHGGAKSVGFSDFSTRSPSSLSSHNPITWSASLYPVIDEGGMKIKVGNGVQWGWNMKPATVGKAAGTFNSPSPTCPPATCSGIGTSSINWGTGSPGGLSFTGAAFSPQVGAAFKIGTINYTNGSTTVGSALDGISLDIALSFDNVSELNFVYHAGMSINNTPNTDDPIASADFVRFAAGSFSDSFNVLEGASASADLMAKLTPVLQITPSMVGDKDGTSVPDSLVFIGYDLQLLALANPTAGGFVTAAAIPLPGTLALMLIGMLAGRMTGGGRFGKGNRS
jgi:hypothetical protein